MRTTADSVARGEPTCAGILVHFRPHHSSIPCADLRLEINRAAAHHGESPHESGFDRLLVPSRLDLEAESKRSFCPWNPDVKCLEVSSMNP